MPRKIKHLRGPEVALPKLEVAEIALTTDTEKVFIGAPTGNVGLAKQKDMDQIVTKTNSLTEQLAEKAKQLGDVAFDKTPVKFVSHRGYWEEAPENTLPAYEKAIEKGFWGLEADICRTSDGVFILHHDDTVDRMTDGTGSIRNLTLDQIKAMTVDTGANIAKYPNLKVPTLEEFLLFCRKNGGVPLLDSRLNASDSEALLEIIRKHDMENRCIVMNSSLAALQSIRELSSTIPIHALFNFTSENIDLCVSLGANTSINVPFAQVTQVLVNEAHSKGIKVNCWTVITSADVKKYTDMGIDYISTDKITPVQNLTPFLTINSKNAFAKVSPFAEVAEAETIPLERWAWNDTYSLIHVNTAATGPIYGNTTIPLGTFKKGDLINLAFYYKKLSGSNPRMRLRFNNSDVLTLVDSVNEANTVKGSYLVPTSGEYSLFLGSVVGEYYIGDIQVETTKKTTVTDIENITKKIDTLYSNIDVTTLLQNSWSRYGVDMLNIAKSGNIVSINLTLTNPNATTATNTMLALPTGFRPSGRIIAKILTLTPGTEFLCSVGSNGVVAPYSSNIPANTPCVINLTFGV